MLHLDFLGLFIHYLVGGDLGHLHCFSLVSTNFFCFPLWSPSLLPCSVALLALLDWQLPFCIGFLASALPWFTLHFWRGFFLAFCLVTIWPCMACHRWHGVGLWGCKNRHWKNTLDAVADWHTHALGYLGQSRVEQFGMVGVLWHLRWGVAYCGGWVVGG